MAHALMGLSGKGGISEASLLRAMPGISYLSPGTSLSHFGCTYPE
jgi:hypothetical protein